MPFIKHGGKDGWKQLRNGQVRERLLQERSRNNQLSKQKIRETLQSLMKNLPNIISIDRT